MLISNYWYLLKDTIYSPLFALYVSLVCQGGEIMIRKVKYIKEEDWNIFSVGRKLNSYKREIFHTCLKFSDLNHFESAPINSRFCLKSVN